MKTAIIAAAVLAAVAGNALAADIPMRVPAKGPAVVAPLASWTGCYLGLGGGYAMWNQDHTTVDATGAAASGEITTGGRGWFGTVQGGCDYQWGDRWVIGVFGDYDYASIKGSFIEPALGVIGREKLAWQWAAGGRLGYLIQPQFLGFFSAGYTQAHFDQMNLGPAGGAVTNRILSNTYDGWFLGTGYEYRLGWLWSGLTWKTEYRFSQFQRDRLQVQTVGGAATGFAVDSNIYEQSIRSELVFRFDGWR